MLTPYWMLNAKDVVMSEMIVKYCGTPKLFLQAAILLLIILALAHLLMVLKTDCPSLVAN